jgi:D-alanyl-D-alanine carboxypeptidase/D-alanyl-D-alanine-endopeptidase (penicillin-binding protein 4)
MRRLAGLLAAALALASAPAHAASLATTQRALAAQMRWAGSHSGALAVDLDTGRTIYASRAGVARVPASVEKLYTTTTALIRLGPEATLDTRVLATAPVGIDGTLDGDLYLKGAGDPTLGPSALADLAGQVAAAGVTRVTGHVVGDESAFDARRGPPSSGYHVSAYVGPLSALVYDRGRTGRSRPYWQADPPSFAAGAFARALRARGVAVAAKGVAGPAPAGALALATHASPPVATLIRLANVPSDNFIAETLLKAIGAAAGSGTTAAGAAAVRSTMGSVFGIAPQVVDGSGLSYADHTSPAQVVQLLTQLYNGDDGAQLRASLAVMGRSGTLRDRLRRSSARGVCQGKTGTLLSVSNLAGYCDLPSGDTVAFAILMNGVNPYGARVLQDRMVAALVRYEP